MFSFREFKVQNDRHLQTVCLKVNVTELLFHATFKTVKKMCREKRMLILVANAKMLSPIMHRHTSLTCLPTWGFFFRIIQDKHVSAMLQFINHRALFFFSITFLLPREKCALRTRRDSSGVLGASAENTAELRDKANDKMMSLSLFNL